MKILVNQIGYGINSESGKASCRAVLQSITSEKLPETVTLRNAEGRILSRFIAEKEEAVHGWKNRKFRVVNFQTPEGGPYTLEAVFSDERGVSAPFFAGNDVVASSVITDILSGFTAGRSVGITDSQDRSIPFYGERKGTVDVHGGWYDASGDTSKYLSHLSYANYMNPQQTPLVVWSLLDSREHLKESPFDMGPRLSLRFLEEAAWGADFLKRMQDPEGYFYTTVFDVWTKDLEKRQICSFSTQAGVVSDDYQAGYRQGGGMAVAALARSSRVLDESVTEACEFSPSDYFEAALKGWYHLEEHNLEYLDDGRENIIDDYCALLAEVELLDAGADTVSEQVIVSIRQAAELRAGNLIRRWLPDADCFRADDEGKRSWFHASDEALPLIALMRAVETGALGKALADEARDTISAALKAERKRALEVSNPFLHPRRLVRVPGRDERGQFFYPHDNPSDYWWQGENSRLASWAAAFRRYGGGKENGEFADAQISWIFGLNPFDACMLKGSGRNNPDYEWDQFNLPGGVSNGITSGFDDENDIDFMPEGPAQDGIHSWRWAEQWIPHAAWLLLAVAWGVPLIREEIS